MYNLHFLQTNIGNNIVIKQVVNFFSNPYEEEFDFNVALNERQWSLKTVRNYEKCVTSFFFFFPIEFC